MIEKIIHQGTHLAYIIRAEFSPSTTTFVTPEQFNQQVGYIVYPADGEIIRHVHLPVERRTTGTSEVLVVRSGLCVMDLFDDSKEFVASRELKPGDVVILISGGHGFRMLEDTILLEVKQGPHVSNDEKERF